MFTLILICIFLYFLGFLCQLGKGGIIAAILICLLSAHAWLCTNVTWYGEKALAPEIAFELKPGGYGEELDPLLGETIVEGEDGVYYLTLTDHRLAADDYDKTADLLIKVAPEGAKLKKADLHLSVTEVAPEFSSDSWQSVLSDAEDKVTTYDHGFQHTIDGGHLRTSESGRHQPTKFIIKAHNKLGDDTKTLIITRQPLYYACSHYSETHPGHVSTDDIALCRERARRAEQNQPNNNSDGSTNRPGANNSGANRPGFSGGHQGCIHHEAGRCWDDLEDEAYGNGSWDHRYGQEGGGYNPPENCTGICQDIYDDAYYEGYYGY